MDESSRPIQTVVAENGADRYVSRQVSLDDFKREGPESARRLLRTWEFLFRLKGCLPIEDDLCDPTVLLSSGADGFVHMVDAGSLEYLSWAEAVRALSFEGQDLSGTNVFQYPAEVAREQMAGAYLSVIDTGRPRADWVFREYWGTPLQFHRLIMPLGNHPGSRVSRLMIHIAGL